MNSHETPDGKRTHVEDPLRCSCADMIVRIILLILNRGLQIFCISQAFLSISLMTLQKLIYPWDLHLPHMYLPVCISRRGKKGNGQGPCRCYPEPASCGALAMHLMVTDKKGKVIVIEYLNEINDQRQPVSAYKCSQLEWHLTNLSNYVNLLVTISSQKIGYNHRARRRQRAWYAQTSRLSRFVRAVAQTMLARKTRRS